MTKPVDALNLTGPVDVRMGLLRRRRGVVVPQKGFFLSNSQAAVAEIIAERNHRLTNINTEPGGIMFAHPRVVVQADSRAGLEEFRADLRSRSGSAAAGLSPALEADAIARRPLVEAKVARVQDTLSLAWQSPHSAHSATSSKYHM